MTGGSTGDIIGDAVSVAALDSAASDAADVVLLEDEDEQPVSTVRAMTDVARAIPVRVKRVMVFSL
jgi:hypothetical protein